MAKAAKKSKAPARKSRAKTVKVLETHETPAL